MDLFTEMVRTNRAVEWYRRQLTDSDEVEARARPTRSVGMDMEEVEVVRVQGRPIIVAKAITPGHLQGR